MPRDYRGLTIRFEGDASSLISSLQQIDAATERTTSMLSRINQGLKLNPTNTRLYAAQTQEYGRLVTSQTERISNLNKAIKENQRQYTNAAKRAETARTKLEKVAPAYAAYYEKYGDGITKSVYAEADALAEAEKARNDYADALENSQQEMVLAEEKLASLTKAQKNAQITEDFHNSSLGKASIFLGDYANALDYVGDKLQRLGGVLTIGSVAGLLTVGRSVLTQTEAFGNEVSRIGGYLELEGAALEHMSDVALQYGKDTRYSAVEAAQAISELAKGGMTQAQIEGGALNATLQLASAGNIGFARAAEVAIQAINVFGLSAENSVQIADALAGAANKSTAEIDGLATAFRYVSGWAGLADYSVNDISGALGLLSDRGLQAEIAGTGLRNVMQRLGAPTDKARAILEEYGVEVYDTEGKMKPLVDLVQELNDAFGGLEDAERNGLLNTIFGARGLPAAVALMESGTEELEKYIDATKRVGYAEVMAQAQMGDLGWALEFLRGEFETFQVNLGQAFTPALINAAKAAENLLTKFNNMSKAEQKAWADGLLEIALVGPKLLVAGTAIKMFAGATRGLSSITRFAGFMKQVAKSADEGSTAFKRFGDAIELTTEGAVSAESATSMLTSSLVLLGAAVAAYIGYRIWRDFDEARKRAEKLDTALENSRRTLDRADLSKLSRELEGAGTSAEETAGSVWELLDSLEHLYDEVEEENRKLEVTAAQLNTDADIIERFGGRTDLSAQQLEILNGALYRVNQELGTNYSLHSDTAGIIYDENDAVVDLTSSIELLLEARKREIELAAYGDRLQKAIEKEAEAQDALTEATRNYQDIKTKFDENGRRGRRNPYYDDLLEAEATLAAAEAGLQTASNFREQAAQQYDEAAMSHAKAAEATRNALRENINTIDGLAEALAEKKISIDDFVGFTTDDFEKMKDECGEDIEKMIQFLQDWKNTKPDNKTVKVTADTSDAERGLGSVKALLNSLKDKSVAVKYKTVYTHQEMAAGGIRTHADGGIAVAAARYHAGGSIVNVPNTGYPLDLVGEAGAEAIVPLTNRRYSQPFVDLIADGVSRRMGGGTSYNLYINGARVNDDPQIRGQFIDLMQSLARKGAMNVGHN